MSARFFFCSSCQTERLMENLGTRLRKRNNNRICTFCETKSGPRRYVSKASAAYILDDYEPPAIPADVLDAYRESHAE